MINRLSNKMHKALITLFIIVFLLIRVVAVNETPVDPALNPDIYSVINPNDGLDEFNADIYDPYSYAYSSANDADNDGYTNVIDCDDNNPDIHPGQNEQCNGVDDNCDGNIDESLVRKYGTDMGECVAGTQRCILGSWIIIDPELGPTTEICDALDNDCDGAVDESLTIDTVNQNGACDGNTKTCVMGVWINDEDNYIPHAELCDNIDNDCDALVDEELNERTKNQKGLCFGNTETCSAGVWLPDYGNYLPENETCDRSDNDCDGFIDEDFDYDLDGYFSGAFCSNAFYSELDCNDANSAINPGKYEICGDGIDQDCDGNDIECNYDGDGDGYTYIIDCNDNNPFINPHSTEICDNVDNNCDGNIDENLNRNSQNQKGLCLGNVEVCQEGNWINGVSNYLIQNESCDGYDNDCDGSIDESLTLPAENQLGMCYNNYQVCQQGGWIDYFGNYEPKPENLDGLDNDCDGQIDENTDITFDIILNKDTYSLNDIASITLVAPDNSSVNVTIVRADGTSQKLNHIGDFPYTLQSDYLGIKGNYQVIAEFSYLYKKQTVQKTFNVVNSMTGEIKIQDYDQLAIDRDIGFIGIGSGGTGPYTYTWDFGDGWTQSGENIGHRYVSAATYTVKLTIKDSNNNEFVVTRSVKIQNRFDITFTFIDEISNKPVEGLMVRFDDENKLTDSAGEVIYTRVTGRYDLNINSNSYKYDKKNIEITGDMKQSYKISKNDKLIPTIDLISPEKGAKLSSDEVTFFFRVIDESPVDCNFYRNEDLKYWEFIGTVDEIGNTNKQSFVVSNLNDGLNTIKIECIDSASNFKELDIDIYASSLIPSQVVEVKDDEIKISQELFEEIDNKETTARDYVKTLESTIKSINELDEKNEIKDSGLLLLIESSKNSFEKLARDLFSLKSGEGSDVQKNFKVLSDNFDNLVSKTPKEVKIIETFELGPKSIDENLVEPMTKEYLMKYDLEDSSIKKLIKKNKELSKSVRIDTKVFVLEVKYLGNSMEDLTLIKKTINGEIEISEIAIIENIEKEIIEDGKLIQTKNTFSIIKEDPILLIKPDDNKEIFYSIPKKLSKDSFSSIQSIAIYENFNDIIGVKGNAITGFFTRIPLGGNGDTKVFVETGLIVLLLVVYIIMQLDISWLFGNKEMKEFKKLINTAKNHLLKKEHEAAQKIYKDIMMRYTTLSGKNKTKIYPKTDNLFNEMVVVHIHNILDNVNKYLENGEHHLAKATYGKVKELYTQLSSGYKTKVSDRSMETYKQLAST